MKAADLTYGGAQKVADWLNQAPGVSVEELTGALVNALNRIHYLENRCEVLETIAARDGVRGTVLYGTGTGSGE